MTLPADRLKPLSRLRLSDLQEAGWLSTVTLARRLAIIGVWKPAEWRVGGIKQESVAFYDPADLVKTWRTLSVDERTAYRIAANP